MEHPKLNELQIYFHGIDRHVMFHLIVEVWYLDDLENNFDHNISILDVF
jgi:hypothetical protein